MDQNNSKEKIERAIKWEKVKVIIGYTLIALSFVPLTIMIVWLIFGFWNEDNIQWLLVMMLWYSFGLILDFQVSPFDAQKNICLLELIKENIENESVEQDKDGTEFEKQE